MPVTKFHVQRLRQSTEVGEAPPAPAGAGLTRGCGGTTGLTGVTTMGSLGINEEPLMVFSVPGRKPRSIRCSRRSVLVVGNFATSAGYVHWADVPGRRDLREIS